MDLFPLLFWVYNLDFMLFLDVMKLSYYISKSFNVLLSTFESNFVFSC